MTSKRTRDVRGILLLLLHISIIGISPSRVKSPRYPLPPPLNAEEKRWKAGYKLHFLSMISTMWDRIERKRE
jgi:hypothetical protein